MTTFKELKKLAEAATPGPWHTTDSVHNGKCYVSKEGSERGDVCLAQNEFCAEFISAANPATVLEMIAMMEQMAEALTRAEEEMGVVWPFRKPYVVKALAAFDNLKGGE